MADAHPPDGRTVTPAGVGRPAADEPLERRWAAVGAKLVAAGFWLQRQGGLVAKVFDGRRVWVVRYVVVEEGRRVHRSIYVGVDGDEELLRRAQTTLDGFRAEGRALGSLPQWAGLAGRVAGDLGCRRARPIGRHRSRRRFN